MMKIMEMAQVINTCFT